MAAERKPNSSDRLKKTQLALYVDPLQATALRALSKSTRTPQQVYLREGLDYILKTYYMPEWRYMKRGKQ